MLKPLMIESVALGAAYAPADAPSASALTLCQSPFGPVTLDGNVLRVGAPVLGPDRCWRRFALLSDALTEEARQFRGAAWHTFATWCIINHIPLLSEEPC